MTYAPPPGYPPSYPPSYGYPARRPSSAGRWAGVGLIVMGILALLFGGCSGAMAALVPNLLQQADAKSSAELQRMIEQIEKDGINFQTRLAMIAVVMGAYAIATLTFGAMLVRAKRSQGALVGGMVVVGLVLLLQAINFAMALFTGAVGQAAMVLVVLAIHGLLLYLLVTALRAPVAPQSGPTYPTPGAYPPGYTQPMPMQGYQYQAPPPPQDQQKPPSV